jgi:hypothetical protein
MRLTFNVKNLDASDWADFWKASDDPNTPIEKYGFQMCVLDLTSGGTRIATALEERMKWVRATVRDEERALRKMGNYAMVHDCKSHRAIENARRGMYRTDKIRTEMNRYIQELLN